MAALSHVATRASTLILALQLIGCGVHVKYLSPVENDQKGLVKFRLQGSLVTLAKKSSDKESKTGLNLTPTFEPLKPMKAPAQDSDFFRDVGAVATPVGASEVFAIVPHEPFWKTAKISYTYFDGANMLVKELGYKIEDHSKEIIETAGALVKLILPFVALVKPPEEYQIPDTLTLPVVIDVSQTANEEWHVLPSNDGWWYRISLMRPRPSVTVSVDPDKDKESSIRITDFLASFGEHQGSATDVFPVSACRTALLLFRRAETKPASTGGIAGDGRIELTIADPRRVETVKIPEGGSIRMKSVCGADVAAGQSSEASAWQLIKEVTNQVKQIRDAQKENEKGKVKKAK